MHKTLQSKHGPKPGQEAVLDEDGETVISPAIPPVPSFDELFAIPEVLQVFQGFIAQSYVISKQVMLEFADATPDL